MISNFGQRYCKNLSLQSLLSLVLLVQSGFEKTRKQLYLIVQQVNFINHNTGKPQKYLHKLQKCSSCVLLVVCSLSQSLNQTLCNFPKPDNIQQCQNRRYS
ncbi:hypothetical protein HAX54_024565 [Datura stramonium]|uniref:Uncharacterized protein n=1 Tax=Datura stramonium TaxID=4076 RepID=A0ABS8UZQ1_DATST|nr:hypothetical protein [Datura stramonium]